MRRLAGLIAAIGILALTPAGHGPRAVLAAQTSRPTGDEGEPREQAPLTLLQINDVYSTTPVDDLGGLARVAAALKQRVAAGNHPTLLVMAGDFLSPSVASSLFKGEQMVAALNAAGLDLATLGNHEFDFGRDVLARRMAEAKWQWVVSNVIDTTTGRPIANASPFVIRTIGTLKVGFIGLCLSSGEISRDKLTGLRIEDPLRAAARYVPILKSRGANVIIAITHLEFEDDRALVDRFPDIDLVIGGHEHFPVVAAERRALISKAGTDAKWVARIDVGRKASGGVERFYELIPITHDLPEEPATAAVVASYENRVARELDVEVGQTSVPLDGDSRRLRTGETNLGDLVADVLRGEAGADVAIVNGGAIRGDRVYPAGPLSRRTLLGMLPFSNTICKVAVTGAILLQALNHGLARLPAAAGQFPQVSGLTMTVDEAAPPDRRAVNVRVNGQELDPRKTYTVALPDYVLGAGDDYTMFKGQRVVISPEIGPLMATALQSFVESRGQIAPAIDGRITLVRR